MPTKKTKPKPQTETVRVFVSLPKGVSEIIERDFKGIGETASERLRNMIISYLNLRGYFVNERGYVSASEVQGKQDVMEKMIFSLLDILEEKGLVNYNQWETRLNKKITEPEP